MYNISYSPFYQAVTIVYSGQLDFNSLVAGTQACVKAMSENSCSRLLIDAREGEFSLLHFEYMQLSKVFAEAVGIFGMVVEDTRRALVVDEISDLVSFVELVAKGRGQFFGSFNCLDRAVSWINS